MSVSRGKDEVQEEKKSRCSTLSHYASSAAGFFYRLPARTLSLITGNFPSKAYIGGIPVVGKLLDLFSKDGRGLDRILTQAFEVGKENKGISWWRFSSLKDAVLLLYPENIKEIALDNRKNIQIEDGSDSFKIFFGPETIFSAPTGSERHRMARHKFMHMLLDPKVLSRDAPKMQKIISRHIDQINSAKDQTIENLERFANSVTLDMIGITKLGLGGITDTDKKKISDIISEATIELANPRNQLIYSQIPTFIRGKSRLDELLEEGHALIRKMLAYNVDSILDKDRPNWLTMWDKDKYNNLDDLNSQNIVNSVKEFLVAGHETTSKLLALSLMLLADPNHKEDLSRLREEINNLEASKQKECKKLEDSIQELEDRLVDLQDAELRESSTAKLADLKKQRDEFRLSIETWGREDIARSDSSPGLPWLRAIIDETLRLYPPIPDMLFKITNGFSFADNTCHVEAGSVVFVSPRFTARTKAVWGEDAEEFKPERFLRLREKMESIKDHEYEKKIKELEAALQELADPELIAEKTQELAQLKADLNEKHLFPYKHSPFGFDPRPCVGREFSKLEVGLLLTRLVMMFDFELTAANGEAMHHPFDFHQIFTLHLAEENVRMKFIPRDKLENKEEERPRPAF